MNASGTERFPVIRKPAPLANFALEGALSDITTAFSRWELWLYLAFHDIRTRYRRTVLGPVWLTITMAVSVVGLGILYGTLWSGGKGLFAEGGQLTTFFPWLVSGMVCWQFLNGIVIDGCSVFINNGTLINTVRTQLTLHVYRVLVTQLVTFLHNLPVFLIAALVVGSPLTPWTLLVIPAAVVLLLNGFWVVMVLGLFSARFRDMPQMAGSLMQLLFFFTPVIWKPEMLGPYRPYADLNPFTHFLEIIRNPLLGEPPRMISVELVALCTVVGWGLAILALARYRRSLPYWVG